MFFSIITVVLNDKANLKKTIDNIKKQSCQDYEYIIVDGESKDDTLEYLNEISSTDKKIRYISEKDTGIYNAMNKGIKLAQGEYILFLGAGDVLYNNDTLMDVKKNSGYDVVYGYGIYSSGPMQGKTVGTKLSLKGFLMDEVAAHQAVYVKTSIMKRYPFNERYKVQADQDALMHMYKDGCSFKYLNRPLCYYDGLGFSSNAESREKTVLDRVNMMKGYFPLLYFIRSVGHWILTGKNFEMDEYE